MGEHAEPTYAVDRTITGAYTFGRLMDELLDIRSDEPVLVRLEVTVAVGPWSKK